MESKENTQDIVLQEAFNVLKKEWMIRLDNPKFEDGVKLDEILGVKDSTHETTARLSYQTLFTVRKTDELRIILKQSNHLGELMYWLYQIIKANTMIREDLKSIDGDPIKFAEKLLRGK